MAEERKPCPPAGEPPHSSWVLVAYDDADGQHDDWTFNLTIEEYMHLKDALARFRGYEVPS